MLVTSFLFLFQSSESVFQQTAKTYWGIIEVNEDWTIPIFAKVVKGRLEKVVLAVTGGVPVVEDLLILPPFTRAVVCLIDPARELRLQTSCYLREEF